jgi:hypothetical protein
MPGGNVKRIIALALSFMASAALLGAAAHSRGLRNPWRGCSLLQQKIHSQPEQVGAGPEPWREALVRRRLSEDLPALQASALELREAELKLGLSVPPVPRGKMAANPRTRRLTALTQESVDYFIMLAMKISAMQIPSRMPNALTTVRPVLLFGSHSNPMAIAPLPAPHVPPERSIIIIRL